MATDDYADRWAAREEMVKRMSKAELQAYSIGLSHVYTDVFEAFTTAFDNHTDMHTLLERISAQWDDVHATQIVRGVA